MRIYRIIIVDNRGYDVGRKAERDGRRCGWIRVYGLFRMNGLRRSASRVGYVDYGDEDDKGENENDEK
jgi:hypothetical protein